MSLDHRYQGQHWLQTLVSVLGFCYSELTETWQSIYTSWWNDTKSSLQGQAADLHFQSRTAKSANIKVQKEFAQLRVLARLLPKQQLRPSAEESSSTTMSFPPEGLDTSFGWRCHCNRSALDYFGNHSWIQPVPVLRQTPEAKRLIGFWLLNARQKFKSWLEVSSAVDHKIQLGHGYGIS